MNKLAGPQLTLELGNDLTEKKCACCGRSSRRVTGFVSAEGNAHAVYVAGWADGHRELGASMVISVGGWGGGSPDARVAIALEWQAIPSGPGCAVIDGPTSRWAGDPVMGRFLTREEVMNSGAAEEALRIADLVFDHDPRFHAFWYSTVQ